MSHTIVRETSNEAGEKILRAKSLNSGVGILNDHTLNAMRKSFFVFFFVRSLRPVGGREQKAGRRKDWVSDWDGLWQCQLWSGQPAQMMSEYEGSWKKKGRRGEPEHKTRAGGSCQVDKNIVKRVKICVGQPLCSLLQSIRCSGKHLLSWLGGSAVQSSSCTKQIPRFCLWSTGSAASCSLTFGSSLTLPHSPSACHSQNRVLLAMRIFCTSVNGLQFIPSVSAIEARECWNFHFSNTLKQPARALC